MGGWAAALTLVLTSPVSAHPHGRMDCEARVVAGPQGLAGIALRLTMDQASSAALGPRLQLDEAGQVGPAKEARQFAELIAGMLRQGGWMMKLQRLGADGEPGGPAIALDDPGPATFSRGPDGRLSVAVQLQPEAAEQAPHGWKLACLDPTWYWATGFASAAELSASAPCQVELEAMRSQAEQAQALQAAAQRAGLPGADAAAPGLLTASGVRAPAGSIRCAAP